ncbi:MAG: heterodisulfide reductase [Proteobacteria bacterium]|nr:heterodisulfide reductase [Pseudomonadota bacterium]
MNVFAGSRRASNPTTRKNMAAKITPKTTSRDFVQKIKEMSGQNVHHCIQCGTCAGSCPMADHMQLSTRKTIYFTQLGLTEVLDSANTCWVCASCHTCTVRCPRGIDIARVMEALRQMDLREDRNRIEPSRIPAGTIREYPQIAMVAGFRKLTS